jgi:hypothetical protein
VRTSVAPTLLALVLVLGAVPAAAKPAANRAPARGSKVLSLWAVLDPGPISGFGFGGRVMLPIEPAGLLQHPRIKDEITLEVGADFIHYDDRAWLYPGYVDYSWNGFLPVVGATWNFWFTPQLAVYPKIDLGYWFGWYTGPDPYPGWGRKGFGGAFAQGAVGLIYRLERASLRVEAGSGLLRLGAGFPF